MFFDDYINNSDMWIITLTMILYKFCILIYPITVRIDFGKNKIDDVTIPYAPSIIGCNFRYSINFFITSASSILYNFFRKTFPLMHQSILIVLCFYIN